MAKGDPLYARLECDFVRSALFHSLPPGARLLYLSLWCYSLELRRAKFKRPDNRYLASIAGLHHHPITSYLQRLDKESLIVLSTTHIEMVGIIEKHQQFQWKDAPNVFYSKSNAPQTPPKRAIGTEPNGTEQTSPPPTSSKESGKSGKGVYSDIFEEFWSIYPRKVNKLGAWSRWKAQKKGGHDALIQAATNYAKITKGRDQDKIMHGTTFLNAHERWKDYIDGGPGMAGQKPAISEKERIEAEHRATIERIERLKKGEDA